MDKLEKKKLYVMCGIPGSGKSTWTKEKAPLLPGNTAVISRDVIRFVILKDGDDYFSREDEVYAKFIEMIKIHLSLPDVDNVVVDATHISRGSRKKLLFALGESIKDVELIAIAIETSIDICLQRNELREGRSRVPDKAIINMRKSYVTPSIEEGFDKIYIYSDNKLVKEIIKDGDN